MPTHPLAALAEAVRRQFAIPVRRARDAWRERQFRALPPERVEAGALRGLSAADLAALLRPQAVAAAWEEDRQTLARLELPEMTGGVNPGDQRALHALVLGLEPRRILEVGTHLGCSTVSMALACRRTGGQIVTCDIADVNEPVRQPWRAYHSAHSPAELLQLAGVTDRVEFRVGDSLRYLRGLGPTFDFVFLDGDHAAATVYRELPLALAALRPGGTVLLHDYYPGNRPLWGREPPLSGPFLAVERLRSEGATFEVLPFGELAWPTRSGTGMSSLALVSRRTS